MVQNWSLKQAFLRTLIAAIVSSALVGAYAFLFGDFGKIEVKILLTTLSISYFSVTALACAAAFERRTVVYLAAAGLTVSVLGFLLFLPSIWAEFWESEALAKTLIILAVFAFSLAQVSLLALVPLKGPARNVFFATAAFVFAVAMLISLMLILDTDDEWLVRIAGVLGILDGCGSLVIPVLYKLGGRNGVPSAAGQASTIELICPCCGSQNSYPVGAFTCNGCGLEITVKIFGYAKAAQLATSRKA